MKRYIASLVSLLIVATSCSDFLDTVPDNRTEVNSADKVAALLVSAYPTSAPLLIGEMSSDNVMDNGGQYDALLLQEQLYLWEDPTEVGTDGVYGVWEACYSAAASANKALESIVELGSPSTLDPQKGEALLCRAYAHFLLATTFCMPYNPETATQHLGIPYVKESGTTIQSPTERGTLQEVYEQIAADIEEGLPLIKDNVYSVPRYHFNKKAANAFAARFYLYYQQWDKVIEYATVAVGNVPSNTLRHWEEDFGGLSQVSDVATQYTSEKVSANLLIQSLYSSIGYVLGPYDIYKRYGHGQPIYQNETIASSGPWTERGGLVISNLVLSNQQKNPFPKFVTYFEYIDKTSGIGYNHAVSVAFSVDEALLARAEAYVLCDEHDYTSALRDINDWIVYHSTRSSDTGSDLTLSDVNTFYNQLAYQPVTLNDDSERSVKKTLNPEGFTVNEGTEENLIQLILQLRRLETLQEGLRWQDLKRYGIEFSHNRAGELADVLTKDDPRRAIQLPPDVINAGMEPNPRN
ncbi:MAG: RagB/SusD family nutrient uptake outer membrane protein [Bacteroides sp.]|nr:RagB/SusD family nutrient uptake outer membrane protein [Bacteroides sp.]